MMIIPQVWDSVMKIIQMVPQKLIVVNNWIEHMLENQPELQAYFEEFSSQAESNIDSLFKCRHDTESAEYYQQPQRTVIWSTWRC